MPNNIDKKPSITITVDGQSHHFDSYYMAQYHIHKFIFEEDKKYKETLCEKLDDCGIKYVYDAKLILEHRHKFWVATTRKGRFNIRRDGKPFVFGKKKMFDLTGKELISFAARWEKVALIE